MLKRSFMIVTLLSGMVPMAAVAGNISTRVMTAGGHINVVGETTKYPLSAGALGTFGQDSSNGTVTQNFVTTGAYYDATGAYHKAVNAGTTVSVVPDSAHGYIVAEVKLNGVKVSAPVTVPPSANAQSVTVKFARQSVAITAHTAVGGSVIPSGTKSAVVGTSVFYTFTPLTGASVQSIAGQPAGAVLTDAVSGVVVPSLPYVGPVKVTFTPAAGVNVDMTPSFQAITVTTGGTQTFAIPSSQVPVVPATDPATFKTVYTPTSQTLAAATSPGATFAWKQVDGPFLGTPAVKNLLGFITTAAIPWTGNVADPSVPFTQPGNYVLQVTATKGTASAVNTVLVKVVADTVPTISKQQQVMTECVNCHNASTVGGTSTLVPAAGAVPAHYTFVPDVYNTWNAGANNTTLCTACHKDAFTGAHPGTPTNSDGTVHDAKTLDCNKCHAAAATGTNGDAHNIVADGSTGCTSCHSVAQNVGLAGFVQDNGGVRAITAEFGKWSHHVTGVTLDNAHCAACHLEGKVVNGKIVVDTTKHMVDNRTHLRNVTDDSDMQWDPAAPNFATMDNFCMTCHSAAGATSPASQAIQTLINANGINAAGVTASALNPFGDTISNKYDKMKRPRVTNVDSQFDTTNNSHHAVKGARYSGRTRTAGARQISSADTFANNSSALLKGKRSTIYDAGNFNALYVPLGTDGTAATSLGDDSTLHCGDCHTVGQWKAGVTTNAAGVLNTVAIGAHGSNNEYMLRNSIGSDERHTQNAYTFNASNVATYTNPNGAFLVCYNCHAYKNYGSIYGGTGLDTRGGQPHAGEYAQGGRCNGPGNTLSFNGYTTGKATDGTQFASRFMGSADYTTVTNGVTSVVQYTTAASYIGEQTNDFGNIFGIQCANCHNSGAGNAYGGIHGSANDTNTATLTVDASVTGGAYIDGMGNTTKVERFLPGLGNAMHVPGTLGGFNGGSSVAFHTYSSNGVDTGRIPYNYTTGGVSNDTNWEQKAWNQTASTVFGYKTGALGATNITGTSTAAGAGCYTLGAATAATSALPGPSVTGAGGSATALLETWGGCEDHGARQGGGDHGFIKAIVRPVTY